ncbi:hypothetical protein F5Y18DRAFT_429329 [Xylariaceae sp. FL1019]|nr:hypothetical protein F5Y18DRAFT_429329 [Xylariaceae sp. FL1019]
MFQRDITADRWQQIPQDADDYQLPTYQNAVHHKSSIAPGIFTSPPSAPTGGRIYERTVGEPSIRAALSPDPQQPQFLQDWCAQLLVKCDDLPRLMREGFHWSLTNIVREDGFAEPFKDPDGGIKTRFTVVRTYYLRDLNYKPLWTAKLIVHSVSSDALRAFRPADLSHNNVRYLRGWNKFGQPVYVYSTEHPTFNINAIYDEEPLSGIWPWPRADTKAPDAQVNDSEDCQQRSSPQSS